MFNSFNSRTPVGTRRERPRRRNQTEADQLGNNDSNPSNRVPSFFNRPDLGYQSTTRSRDLVDPQRHSNTEYLSRALNASANRFSRDDTSDRSYDDSISRSYREEDLLYAQTYGDNGAVLKNTEPAMVSDDGLEDVPEENEHEVEDSEFEATLREGNSSTRSSIAAPSEHDSQEQHQDLDTFSEGSSIGEQFSSSQGEEPDLGREYIEYEESIQGSEDDMDELTRRDSQKTLVGGQSYNERPFFGNVSKKDSSYYHWNRSRWLWPAIKSILVISLGAMVAYGLALAYLSGGGPRWDRTAGKLSKMGPPENMAELIERLQMHDRQLDVFADLQDKVNELVQSTVPNVAEMAASFKSQLSSNSMSLHQDLTELQSQVSNLRERQRAEGDASTQTMHAVQQQMDGVKSDLASVHSQIQQHEAKLDTVIADFKAQLADSVPSQVPVRIAEDGTLDIMPEFWHALDDEIRSRQLAHGPDQQDEQSFGDRIARVVDAYLSNNENPDKAIITKQYFMQMMNDKIAQVRNEMTSRLAQTRGTAEKIVDGNMTDSGTLEQIVQNALQAGGLDPIRSPDFAALSAGGNVNTAFTSASLRKCVRGWLGKSLCRLLPRFLSTPIGRPPAVALHPDTTLGMCWAFEGQQGQLGIRLAAGIMPSEIVVEHVAREQAVHLDTAPREFEVWVEMDETKTREEMTSAARRDFGGEEGYVDGLEDKYALIGRYTYDIRSSVPIQRFPVSSIVGRSRRPVRQMVVRFRNNWGNPDFTCIYRVRVLGRLAR